MLILAALLAAAEPAPAAGEEPVPPYELNDANAGATPYARDLYMQEFGGPAGMTRVVDRFIALNTADPRIGDIFKGHDLSRLRRVLAEQFCYLLGGGCSYSGRSMAASHKDLGLQTADFNALVENLQSAMRAEGVGFRAQNKLLAKLAPMKRAVVER